MPVRIQRKRTKGWRLPPNTISVCRPGKWGNPYIVGVPIKHQLTAQEAVISGVINAGDYQENLPLTAEQAVGLYRWSWERYPESKPDLSEIRGYNLACYCSLDTPCHADVLIELANQQ